MWSQMAMMLWVSLIAHDGASSSMSLSDFEEQNISRVLVETDDCMLYERGPWKSRPSIENVRFKCSDTDEMNPFAGESGAYLIETGWERDRYLEVAYCSDHPGVRYGRVQEGFESLPLHRLDIYRVEVYPSCVVVPAGLWRVSHIQTKKSLMYTQWEGFIVVKNEKEQCWIYEYMQRQFPSWSGMVEFACRDEYTNRVVLFEGEPHFYDFHIKDGKGGRYLYVLYCETGREKISKVRERFETLPLDRLNLSRVEVYPACATSLEKLWGKTDIQTTGSSRSLLYDRKDVLHTNIIIEKNNCMIYRSVRFESTNLVEDINFKCLNVDELKILTTEYYDDGIYNVSVENIEDNLYLYFLYCKNNRENISKVQEKLETLPIDRLKISKVAVYPDCEPIPNTAEDWISVFLFWFRNEGVLIGDYPDIKPEYKSGRRHLVEFENCKLFESHTGEMGSPFTDIKFKCKDSEEIIVFTAREDQYFMEIRNTKTGRLLSIAYCSGGRESFDKVQESFESLPLERLNIAKVEVYPACGVILRRIRDEWVEFLEEQGMDARVPGAEVEGTVGSILIEVDDCMLYERLRPGSASSLMDVKFTCENMDDVDLFSEKADSYLIETSYIELSDTFDPRNVEDTGYLTYKLEVAYCPDRLKINPEKMQERFEALPLDRLYISEVEVYPVC